LPYRLDLGRKNENNTLSIKFCWNCFADLSITPLETPPLKMFLHQKEITESIIRSETKINYRDVLFLRGVIFLASVAYRIYRRRENHRINMYSFSNLSSRKVVMNKVCHWLQNWPEKLQMEITNSNLCISKLVQEKHKREKIPFWVYKAICTRI
jgi:hypothetical protein